jgi:DNA-binding CsgD family transcriptional regulator
VTLSETEAAPAAAQQLSPALAEALGHGALAGRDREMAELWQAVAEGYERSPFLLLSGEAGVGKTRLAADLARLAHEDGHTVLYGRCQPRPTAPYEPFVEALRAAWQLGSLDALPGPTQHYVATLLPGESDLREAPRRHGVDVELEQLRLFDAVVAALDECRGSGPGLLILEDLHWAESSTLALLTHLLTQTAPNALTVLGTARSPDPDRGQLLDPALLRIGRSARVRRFDVRGLDARGVETLVSDWAGREAPPKLALDLRSHTGGNPLLLRSTLQHLRAEGLLFPDGEFQNGLSIPARSAVPANVMDLARGRLASFEPETRELLAAAALVGAEFSLDEARAAAGLDLEDAVRAAEIAEGAGFVHQLDAPKGTLTFGHELVRGAIAGVLSPSRSALLHLRIAEVIEQSPSAPARSAELAQHYGEALAFGGAEHALVHARAAAESAELQLAFEDVVTNLELALRALDALGERDWHERYALLMALGRARYRHAGPIGALPVFAQAADLAEAAGAPEEMARAGLGVGLERYLRHVGIDELALGLLDRALEALDDSPSLLRVRVMAARALERCFVDPLSVRVSDIRAGIEMAEQLGDPLAELVIHTAKQTVLWHPAHTEALLADMPHLLSLAHDAGRLDLAMHLHCTAFGHALELGSTAEMDAHLSAAIVVAETLRAPVQRLRTLALQIVHALIRGELEQARAQIEDTWSLLDEAHEPLTRPVLMLWSFMLERDCGDVGGLREPFESALPGMPPASIARAVVAEICARSGDVAAAREHLDVLAANGFDDVHEDFLWLSVLTVSATTATIVRDEERAARLYELLSPHAGRNVVLGLAAADRPVSHALGLLARLLGRPDEAIAHFERAADDAEAFGALPWRAEALFELGATLRRAGRVRESRGPLRQSLDLASRFGGTNLAEHATTELRVAGVRPRRARLSGTEALTPSEQRVAELAAAGLSNEEIARDLVLARRTVETHLTHVYRKLGIERRGMLAEALGAEGS